MADHIYVVPKLDDKLVIALFRSLIAKHRPGHCTIDPAGLRNVDLLNPDDQAVSVINRLEQKSSFLISKITALWSGFHIIYVRGGEITSEKRSSALLDEIKVNRQDNQPNELKAEARLDLVEVLLANLDLQSGNLAVAGREPGRSLEDLDALYRGTVLKLENSFAEQIDKITSWTVEKTGEFQKREIQLGEETAAERARAQKEYDELRERLKAREDDLAAREKTFDNREYMHARRATRGDIQKVISDRQKQFTLTPQTRSLRVPIHIVLIITSLALGALNVANFTQLLMLDWAQPSYVHLWGIARQGTLTLALAGTLYFYVRWMNRWFEQHATAELLLKEFQLDIDRASWVVETALEWRRAAEAELPDPLLQGITRNLFERSHSDERKASVADELASALMGSAAGLKLKVGENELNFTRRGLGKLDKISAGNQV